MSALPDQYKAATPSRPYNGAAPALLDVFCRAFRLFCIGFAGILHWRRNGLRCDVATG
jgi:hypothetical protein